jgi:hypothetical protein
MMSFVNRDLCINRDDWQNPIFAQLVIYLNLVLVELRLGLKNRQVGEKCEDTDLNKVDVWFQDETRIGQQGSITRIWAEKGTRPRAVRQQQFEYGYIFGPPYLQSLKPVYLLL